MKCESRRCSWSAKFDDRPYRATANHLLGLVGAAETPSRQNRSITTQCGRQAHGLPRQRELRGDRSSAIQRPHRHDRGPSGCLASLSPSSCDMVAHPDVLRAKGRGLKWRRFSVAGGWRWPWNERARAAGRRGARRRGRLHCFRQECPEGDHNIDVEGNSTCQSGRFVRNTRVSPCGS